MENDRQTQLRRKYAEYIFEILKKLKPGIQNHGKQFSTIVFEESGKQVILGFFPEKVVRELSFDDERSMDLNEYLKAYNILGTFWGVDEDSSMYVIGAYDIPFSEIDSEETIIQGFDNLSLREFNLDLQKLLEASGETDHQLADSEFERKLDKLSKAAFEESPSEFNRDDIARMMDLEELPPNIIVSKYTHFSVTEGITQREEDDAHIIYFGIVMTYQVKPGFGRMEGQFHLDYASLLKPVEFDKKTYRRVPNGVVELLSVYGIRTTNIHLMIRAPYKADFTTGEIDQVEDDYRKFPMRFKQFRAWELEDEGIEKFGIVRTIKREEFEELGIDRQSEIMKLLEMRFSHPSGWLVDEGEIVERFDVYDIYNQDVHAMYRLPFIRPDENDTGGSTATSEKEDNDE